MRSSQSKRSMLDSQRSEKTAFSRDSWRAMTSSTSATADGAITGSRKNNKKRSAKRKPSSVSRNKRVARGMTESINDFLNLDSKTFESDLRRMTNFHMRKALGGGTADGEFLGGYASDEYNVDNEDLPEGIRVLLEEADISDDEEHFASKPSRLSVIYPDPKKDSCTQEDSGESNVQHPSPPPSPKSSVQVSLQGQGRDRWSSDGFDGEGSDKAESDSEENSSGHIDLEAEFKKIQRQYPSLQKPVFRKSRSHKKQEKPQARGLSTMVDYNPGFIFPLMYSRTRDVGARIPILIPDTVIFKEGSPLEWFCCLPNGRLLKKRKKLMLSSIILDIFCNRLRKKGSSDIIAQFVCSNKTADGERRNVIEYFTKDTLKTFLTTRGENKDGFLQQFVEPASSSLAIYNSMLHVQWSRVGTVIEQRTNFKDLRNTKIDMLTRAVTFDGAPMYGRSEMVHSETLTNRINTIASGIADHIMFSTPEHVKVKNMSLYFKIGQQNKLYFLWCSAIDCHESSAGLASQQVRLKTVFRAVSPDLGVPATASGEYYQPKLSMGMHKRGECKVCGRVTVDHDSFKLSYANIIDKFGWEYVDPEREARRKQEASLVTTRLKSILKLDSMRMILLGMRAGTAMQTVNSRIASVLKKWDSITHDGALPKGIGSHKAEEHESSSRAASPTSVSWKPVARASILLNEPEEGFGSKAPPTLSRESSTVASSLVDAPVSASGEEKDPLEHLPGVPAPMQRLMPSMTKAKWWSIMSGQRSRLHLLSKEVQACASCAEEYNPRADEVFKRAKREEQEQRGNEGMSDLTQMAIQGILQEIPEQGSPNSPTSLPMIRRDGSAVSLNDLSAHTNSSGAEFMRSQCKYVIKGLESLGEVVVPKSELPQTCTPREFVSLQKHLRRNFFRDEDLAAQRCKDADEMKQRKLELAKTREDDLRRVRQERAQRKRLAYLSAQAAARNNLHAVLNGPDEEGTGDLDMQYSVSELGTPNSTSVSLLPKDAEDHLWGIYPAQQQVSEPIQEIEEGQVGTNNIESEILELPDEGHDEIGEAPVSEGDEIENYDDGTSSHESSHRDQKQLTKNIDDAFIIRDDDGKTEEAEARHQFQSDSVSDNSYVKQTSVDAVHEPQVLDTRLEADQEETEDVVEEDVDESLYAYNPNAEIPERPAARNAIYDGGSPVPAFEEFEEEVVEEESPRTQLGRSPSKKREIDRPEKLSLVAMESVEPGSQMSTGPHTHPTPQIEADNLVRTEKEIQTWREKRRRAPNRPPSKERGSTPGVFPPASRDNAKGKDGAAAVYGRSTTRFIESKSGSDVAKSTSQSTAPSPPKSPARTPRYSRVSSLGQSSKQVSKSENSSVLAGKLYKSFRPGRSQAKLKKGNVHLRNRAGSIADDRSEMSALSSVHTFSSNPVRGKGAPPSSPTPSQDAMSTSSKHTHEHDNAEHMESPQSPMENAGSAMLIQAQRMGNGSFSFSPILESEGTVTNSANSPVPAMDISNTRIQNGKPVLLGPGTPQDSISNDDPSAAVDASLGIHDVTSPSAKGESEGEGKGQVVQEGEAMVLTFDD